MQRGLDNSYMGHAVSAVVRSISQKLTRAFLAVEANTSTERTTMDRQVRP